MLYKINKTNKSLCLQKRLAMDLLKCGKDKIWLNPNKIKEIYIAKTSNIYKQFIYLK